MTSMVRFSPSLLFTFFGGMITKVFCISLPLTTLLFYKNNFITTKVLILGEKKLKTSSGQSQACPPSEHKNKVPMLVILKIIRTKHQNSAWLSLS